MSCGFLFTVLAAIGAFVVIRAIFRGATSAACAPAPRPEPVRAQPFSSPSFVGRVFWLLVLGFAVFGVTRAFREYERQAVPPPPERPMHRMGPRELQQYAAERAVARAAEFGRKSLDSQSRELQPIFVELLETDTTRPLGTPAPGVAIQLRAKSKLPHADDQAALDDALSVAREKIVEAFRALDPPIAAAPTVEEVRRDYFRRDSVRPVLPRTEDKEAWEKAGLGTNRKWVEIAVEVSENQVRGLRGRERLTDGGLAFGAAFVLFAVTFAFLRLDTWTKGYLTAILGVSAATVAGGTVAALLWMR